jgi:hypothetical protein
MKRARAPRLVQVLLCGCAAAALSACDEAADGGEDPPDNPEGDGLPGSATIAEPEPGAPIGCITRVPGAGFASVSLPAASRLAVIEFEATATALQLDGVIGLGSGTPSSYEQLAGAVRFAPGGTITARTGSSYRADRPVPFQANRMYPVRVVADVAARAYSVYVQVGADVIQLARSYPLRAPQGAATTSLDSLSAIVGGASGQLSICNVHGDAPSAVAYSREGAYAVTPLPGDQALVSDGVSTTWKLGAAGQVLGQVARGGEVAVDEAGNVYIALAADGQLAIHAFTPALAPRWSRVDPVEEHADVRAVAADAAGVTISLTTSRGVSSIRRYPAAGGAGVKVYGEATMAALTQGGFAVATTWDGWVTVSFLDPSGNLRWHRAFANDASVEVMTLGLDGRVVLGGHFWQPIAFGGPTLELAGGELDVNSYAVALARADGAHVFTTRIPTTILTGAAANAGRLVIAGEDWVTPIFPHLWQLDAAGNRLPGEPYVGFYEQWGRSGRVAIGASNRIYWERSMVWPSPYSPEFPYLLAITPQ